MDSHYTTQLVLSILFFAPGIVLLGGLGFLGLLMLLEKTVLKGRQVLPSQPRTQVPGEGSATNPAPGQITAALKAAVAEQQAGARPAAANDRAPGQSDRK